MKKNKIKKCALIASLAALVLVGSTAAFLTSTDITNNIFNVAKVDLEITENFDENKTLSAGEIINKQPSVKNKGNVRQLFFAEVYVPCMNVTLLDSSGQRIPPEGSSPTDAAGYRQNAEVFNLLAEGIPAKAYITEPLVQEGVLINNLEFSYNTSSEGNAGWRYMSLKENVPAENGMQEGNYNVYLFGYSAWVEPGASTIPIFDKIQLRSVIDADIESETIGQITVKACTVQAEELNISGLAGNGSTESLYTDSDLKKIYTVYQNKTQEGDGA